MTSLPVLISVFCSAFLKSIKIISRSTFNNVSIFLSILWCEDDRAGTIMHLASQIPNWQQRNGTAWKNEWSPKATPAVSITQNHHFAGGLTSPPLYDSHWGHQLTKPGMPVFRLISPRLFEASVVLSSSILIFPGGLAVENTPHKSHRYD